MSKGPICLNPIAVYRDDSGHRRLGSEAEFVDEAFVEIWWSCILKNKYLI